MIHIWYNPMDQAHYAQFSAKRLKLNESDGVMAYVDGLCDSTVGFRRGESNRIHIPFTDEVWDKLREYGVEVVR